MSLKNLKFRAWDKFDKEMLEVHGINFDAQGIWTREMIDDESDSNFVFLDDVELLQYTGLKDKNDVEIYEGDVLKGPMDFGPAGFVQSVAPVSYHKINGYQLHYFLLEHTEVIGNVYEDKNIKFGTMEEWWIVIADGLLKW